jgi:uncharacterized protein (TIGR00369 family)
MCFVCGRENPVGLRLDFHEDHEAHQVKASVTVPDTYQGYPGVVHGGIVSTILDEISGRAVMMDQGHDRLFATLRMTVRFRRPTPTETPLTAVGWVRQIGGIGAKVAGEIRLPDGTVTADCEALLTEPPESFKEAWEDEMRYWKVYD